MVFIFKKYISGNLMAGKILAGDFLAHAVIFGDFMAGNFLAGDFLGGLGGYHMYMHVIKLREYPW